MSNSDLFSDDSLIDGLRSSKSTRPSTGRKSLLKLPSFKEGSASTVQRKPSMSPMKSQLHRLTINKTSGGPDSTGSVDVLPTPKSAFDSQPFSFIGITPKKDGKEERRVSIPYVLGQYKEDPQTYLSRTVLPQLLPVIERLLALVKNGEEPKQAILFIAEGLSKLKTSSLSNITTNTEATETANIVAE
ncbi:hypothetical protein BC833DRAFT_623878 [Globomyces pollinis-pini]|nr:hypothetical protein BC833DRAFT_623878 [Globomyces pollinis-pini]